MVNLLIFGPPGSGKGTLADKFSSRYGIIHISTGDIFREHLKKKDSLGLKISSLSDGGLVPDELTNEVVKDRLSQQDAKDGFILDGFPRTINQALFLEKLLTIDGVIFVDLSDEKIIDRISHRRVCPSCGKIYNLLFNKPIKEGFCDVCGHELILRDDDKPSVVKNRLEVYQRETFPIMKLFEKQKIPLIHIKGDYDLKTELENVLSRISSWIESNS